MFRFSFLSCRLFFFTYAHSFFTTSVRGSGLSPTIFASAGLGCMAFMKAAFGLRAVFLAGFFAAFLAAIRVFLPIGELSPLENPRTLTEADRLRPAFSLGERRIFTLGTVDEARSSGPRPRNPQDRRALPPQEERERSRPRRGRRKPLALLLSGDGDQGLSSGGEEAGCVLQFALCDGLARRRRELSDYQRKAAGRQPVGREERLASLDGESERSRVLAQECEVQEVPILRDDLRRPIAGLQQDRECAVSGPEGERPRRRLARQRLCQRPEEREVIRILGGVV